MSLSVANLRTFVEVARAGNITDAAEVLGRTPSAVSMTLKQFEEHLGHPLFEGDRKAKLTSVGRFVLEQAEKEVAHFDRTVDSIDKFARNEIGIVRLACVPSFANQVLPRVLSHFREKWPNIGLDILDTDSETVCRMIELEQIDIGLGSSAAMGPEFTILPLLQDPFGVACRSDDPFVALKRPITFRDLQDRPFIANGLCARITASPIQYIVKDALLMVRNTTSIISLIDAGAGVTILPELAVPPDHPTVRFLPLAGIAERRSLNIITLARTSLSPAAQVLIEALLDFATGPGRPRGHGAVKAARMNKL